MKALPRERGMCPWRRLMLPFLPLRRTLILLAGGVTLLITASFLSVIQGDFGSKLWNPSWQETICDPRTDIVFLKTHKCASSSIQNILLRYGDRNNLTFVLPTRNNYFGHPEPFQRIFVPDKLNRSFNILTHHTRYARKEMALLMPKDTVYITIIRSPIELLESVYAYYNLKDYYQMELETMSSNKTNIESVLGTSRYYRRVGLNQMSFDLGLNVSLFNNETATRNFLRSIDQQFDLVMVYERLEESLVLLSDLLCWPLQDVVVFKLNARKKQYKKTLSSPTKDNLKEVSKADVLLYEYFAKRFQERVSAYGAQRMAAKLAELREVTDVLNRRCVGGLKAESNATDQGFNEKYVVMYEAKDKSDLECQNMLRDELKYTEILRKKQNSPPY